MITVKYSKNCYFLTISNYVKKIFSNVDSFLNNNWLTIIGYIILLRNTNNVYNIKKCNFGVVSYPQ